jgi:hypothetical protein
MAKVFLDMIEASCESFVVVAAAGQSNPIQSVRDFILLWLLGS